MVAVTDIEQSLKAYILGQVKKATHPRLWRWDLGGRCDLYRTGIGSLNRSQMIESLGTRVKFIFHGLNEMLFWAKSISVYKEHGTVIRQPPANVRWREGCFH